MKILLFVSFAFLTFNAQAAEEKAESPGAVVCTNKSETRKLEIINEGSGCKVNYTKGEAISVIGSQKSGTDFCDRLLEKVKTKLSGLGFECN